MPEHADLFCHRTGKAVVPVDGKGARDRGRARRLDARPLCNRRVWRRKRHCQVGILSVRNPARRIAATLLRIAPEPEAGKDACIIVTQDQLGEVSNAGRDVVNRALRQFARAGWISAVYRSITLLRHELLARFVEEGT